MLIVIRISGMVEIPEKVNKTLHDMRLRRKYSAILMNDSVENRKLLMKVRNFVAYGKLNEKTFEMLIEKRAEVIAGKKMPSVSEVIKQIGKKSFEEIGIKPFFRLHPPRGGIDSKVHFGTKKGVLGDNKEDINKLLEKML